MTIKEYLKGQLQSFDLNEAVLTDISLDNGINLEEEYNAETQKTVGMALAKSIEFFIFTPRMTNISENGFSQSWDYANLGKYYLWLCRRWGIVPNAETVAAVGLSTITDKTSSW